MRTDRDGGEREMPEPKHHARPSERSAAGSIAKRPIIKAGKEAAALRSEISARAVGGLI